MIYHDWFLAHGIDINHPDFTRWVHDAPHRNILHKGNSPQNPGGAWNKRWRDFMDMEIDDVIYTREQVIANMTLLKGHQDFRIP